MDIKTLLKDLLILSKEAEKQTLREWDVVYAITRDKEKADNCKLVLEYEDLSEELSRVIDKINRLF